MKIEELQAHLQAHYHLREHGNRFKNLRKMVEDALDAAEAELMPQAPAEPKAIPSTEAPEEESEIERRV